MPVRLRIFLFLSILSSNAWSQEREPVYILIGSKDITFKLFNFSEAGRRLLVFFNISSDFSLYGVKQPVIIFRYQYNFTSKDFSWAEPLKPAKELKELNPIGIQAFTDSILRPGQPKHFLSRKDLFLVIHDPGNNNYELYPVAYASPTLADPHDLHLEEHPKDKNKKQR